MKAKFSQKIKQEIAERDGCCIIPGCTNCGPPHHIYYGLQADRTENRNKANAGVILCQEHHLEAHGCRSGEGLREYCITYLKGNY